MIIIIRLLFKKLLYTYVKNNKGDTVLKGEKYPDVFYRGISNKDFIIDGRVTADAFQFSKEDRGDGYKDLSINWNDDGNALRTALEQRKSNGKIQFAAGVASLNMKTVKIYLSPYFDKKQFGYERQELPDNIYHGNLLVTNDLAKGLRSLISSGLALATDSIFPQINE